MNHLTNLIVYFVSTPSVYTLPGTWEPQPGVLFDSTFLITSASVVFVFAIVLSVLALKKKKKKI